MNDKIKRSDDGNIDEKVECYANILACVYLSAIFLALIIVLAPWDKMSSEWQSSGGNTSAYIQSPQAASLSMSSKPQELSLRQTEEQTTAKPKLVRLIKSLAQNVGMQSPKLIETRAEFSPTLHLIRATH